MGFIQTSYKNGRRTVDFVANPSSNKVSITGSRDINYRRSFGGKRKHVFIGIEKTKSDALKVKNKRKSWGGKARVVKTKAGYVLYG